MYYALKRERIVYAGYKIWTDLVCCIGFATSLRDQHVIDHCGLFVDMGFVLTIHVPNFATQMRSGCMHMHLDAKG